jgi:hypothetical protein
MHALEIKSSCDDDLTRNYVKLIKFQLSERRAREKTKKFDAHLRLLIYFLFKIFKAHSFFILKCLEWWRL